MIVSYDLSFYLTFVTMLQPLKNCEKYFDNPIGRQVSFAFQCVVQEGCRGAVRD